MQILNNVPSNTNIKYVKEQCLCNVYPVSDTITDNIKNKLLPGVSVILFSGGYRLDFDGIYIEPKMFKQAELPWQQGTIFIDPDDQHLLEYTLKKLNISNLIIVHSTVFVKYRKLDVICQHIAHLKGFAKQVVVSIPINRMDFNRLRYSNKDIANNINATLVEDGIIICQ